MKKLLLFSVLFIYTSCNDFETKKMTSEEILSEETRELNWHEVDQYPAFAKCRDIMEVQAAKACFGNTVASHIYARLEKERPVVTEALNDTLMLYLIISEKGIPTIDSIEIGSVVNQHLPQIKLWLNQSIDSLPQIFPANKRGIPVATKFKMPIVIQAK